ncbi:MAG: catalase/peroxidase HPI [Pseudomonadota bacterium]
MFKKKLCLSVAMASSLGAAVIANAGSFQGEPKAVQDWWPESLNLSPLRDNANVDNPYGANFSYAEAFATLDLDDVKADIEAIMTTSQDWWPADYGNYGPLFIRMAWHSAGTYRTMDGRGGAGGGQQRFEPLNSWPDNGNLDKARRLVWPVKQKYGAALSWSDLMILAGNVALENMGFKAFGFAGGREDDWQPDLVYWGPESVMLADERYTGERNLQKPLAAVQMGLIYVNPEGPNGVPDPQLAANDIRETFGRMAMDDAETVALIAGGHTFGKGHGAHKPDDCVGPEPAGEGIEDQGMGWHNRCGKGNAEDTVTSGLEGAWTSTPTQWSMMYLANLFAYEWEQTRSPAGALQWIPKDGIAADTVPDAHLEGVRHAPIMFTTDLALKTDPSYKEISKRFLDNPAEFEDAFARAWFKLTHRDMGPRARYLGDDVPEEVLSWQDPVPPVDHDLIDDGDVAQLKARIKASEFSTADLIRTAWASAASYRDSDMRGGANGARIMLAPQNSWDVNDPTQLSKVLERLERIQTEFNEAQRGSKKVSMADVIVLAGAAAIEQAAEKAGYDLDVPFNPGRTDATQEQTDVASFAVLEPVADGFRNYYGPNAYRSPANALVDKAELLDLTVPEMAVLVAGMRTLDANAGGSQHGVFTDDKEALDNDFFVNLLDMNTQWRPSQSDAYVLEGRDRATGELRYTATEVDLVFGSNSELRAIAEVYAFDGAQEKFVNDFVSAWNKVMEADRFDLRNNGAMMASN